MGISALLSRMGRLIWLYSPALAAIWLVGDVMQSALRWGAVLAGQQNRMAGIAVLTLAILVRIVVIVTLFRLIEERAPAAAPVRASPRMTSPSRPMARDVAMVLVPFFVYYTAWGLLGDMMRSYALMSMDMDPLGRFGPLLDINPGQAAIIWILGAWLVRRLAKTMQSRQPDAVTWPFLVVAAEAMWIFCGIYLISEWKDEIKGFIAHLPVPWDWPALIGKAFAEGVVLPATTDRTDLTVWQQVKSVALFAVLPLVWFNLGAIIRGSDVTQINPELARRTRQVSDRWDALPRVVRDFAGHFVGGIVKRWRAVANAVQTMMTTSLSLLLAVVVGYRLIDWLAGWGIWASMQAIGPLPYGTARMVEPALDLIWGTPRSPGGGMLPEILKIILISAALDLALRESRAERTVTVATAQPDAASA